MKSMFHSEFSFFLSKFHNDCFHFISSSLRAENVILFEISAYVKSNTVVGDSKHSTGVVLAEIVRANIPVKNGVVHLIHRPLMVVDTTVKQFLEVWISLVCCIFIISIRPVVLYRLSVNYSLNVLSSEEKSLWRQHLNCIFNWVKTKRKEKIVYEQMRLFRQFRIKSSSIEESAGVGSIHLISPNESRLANFHFTYICRLCVSLCPGIWNIRFRSRRPST